MDFSRLIWMSGWDILRVSIRTDSLLAPLSSSCSRSHTHTHTHTFIDELAQAHIALSLSLSLSLSLPLSSSSLAPASTCTGALPDVSFFRLTERRLMRSCGDGAACPAGEG